MKKILCIPPRGIGDIIFSLPLLHSLKKAHPDSEIYILTIPTNTEIINLVGFLKNTPKFLPLPSNNMLAAKRKQAIKKGNIKQRHHIEKLIFDKCLKGEQYDLAIITTEVKTNFSISTINCPRQISENDLKPYSKDCHMVDRFLRFAKYLGIEENICFNLCIDDTFTAIKSPYVVLHVGGKNTWSLQGYVETAKECLKRKLDVIMTGGPGNFNLASKIHTQEPKIINTVLKNRHQFSLKDYALLTRKAKAVIGPDTGPIHVADAVGSKVICLFGLTSHKNFAPYNNKENVISRYFKDKNIKNIKTSEVMEKLEYS